MKIDTQKWKCFKVGHIFNCETTKGIPSKNDLCDGDIPYITRSAENNGLSGYCGNNSHKNAGACITIGAEGFTAFWQDEDFVAGNKVYAIRHQKMSKENGLFICSALNALSHRYSFKEARTLDKIKEEIIKLPSRVTIDYSLVGPIGGGGIDMSKIDTSSWKKFKLGDLFTIIRGTSKTMRDLEEGDIPVIAAARSNNGIAMYADIKPEYENAITVSCNGVGCGSTFYQKGKFAVNGDASVLIAKKPLNDDVKLGLTAILDSTLFVKYSYEDKCSPEKLKNETILLPAKEEPDWEYMEQYMKSVMGGCRKQSASLLKFAEEKHRIDTIQWGEFRVGDLFIISPTKNYGLSNTLLFETEGNTPVVVNSSMNNGIGGYVELEPTENGNVITFSDTTDVNSIFYQKDPFVGYSHVQAMSPLRKNKWQEESMLFFLTCFQKQALTMKFDYANKFRRDIAENICIKLPITSSGEPDWNYMEQYIKQIMLHQNNVIMYLSQLAKEKN